MDSRRPSWRQHFAGNWRSYAATMLLVAVALIVLRQGYREFDRWQLERADATDWLEYHEIRYLGEDPDGRAGLGSLRFVSDRTLYRDVQLRFIDTLRCRPADGQPFEFVTQNPVTESFRAEADKRRDVRWLYNADYPVGRECEMQSTIEATVHGVTKRLQVTSDLFVIGE